MIKHSNSKILQNTASLYVMNIAKMILPLITLPYLTRILTKDCYGVVSYVKAVMQYMQLIVDFGFLLSGTKDIVNARQDRARLETENSNIFAARLLLGGISGAALAVLCILIPLLRENLLYTVLSFAVVFLTCFLFDHLFRGLEQMHIITIRFVVMKSIAAALTFVFVRSDADVLWIPILDILGSLVAVALVFAEMHKRQLRLRLVSFKSVIAKIRESFVYFISDTATTAFGALNTLLIGIFMTSGEVATWGLCMQLAGAVQSLYTPLTSGIYPEMIKTKNIGLVKKALKIFMPIVTIGCLFTLFAAKYVLLIIGGAQYVDAAPVLRCLVPVLFFSFPSMLLGWPTLGAIGKTRETTLTTILTAVLQILGLIILIACGRFTLINIALLRGATELVLLALRFGYCKKFANEFN